ncbi:MAG: hypothetical protein V1743_03655 [Nanoarchaeota archaeon]
MKKQLAFLLVLFIAIMAVQAADDDICPAQTDEQAVFAMYPELAMDVEVMETENAEQCINTPNTCTDTDGGIEIFTRGTVSGTFFGHAYAWSDYCMPCFPNKLVEFYCHDGNCGSTPRFQIFTCELGCDNGECIDREIPEFGLLAGGVAVIGAIAGFFLLRKRK